MLVGFACRASKKDNDLSAFAANCSVNVSSAENRGLTKEGKLLICFRHLLFKILSLGAAKLKYRAVFLWFFGGWDLSCARILNKFPREWMNEARCLQPKEQDLRSAHNSTGSCVIPGEVSLSESTNFQWFCRHWKNSDECEKGIFINNVSCSDGCDNLNRKLVTKSPSASTSLLYYWPTHWRGESPLYGLVGKWLIGEAFQEVNLQCFSWKTNNQCLSRDNTCFLWGGISDFE